MSPKDLPHPQGDTDHAPAKGWKGLKSSYKAAIVIAVLAFVWMASGVLTDSEPPAEAPAPVNAEAATGSPGATETPQNLPRVRVTTLTSQRHTPMLSLMGVTEAGQAVSVRTEIPGRVEEVVAEKGAFVEQGDVLVRLDNEDRAERLAEARARLKQRQIAHESARKLSQGGYSSQLSVAQAEADLAAARAQVTRMERELANTEITAPFSGVLDMLPVEQGDYLDKAGQIVARVIDLSTIKALGHVTERNVSRIDTGGTAQIHLPDGRRLEGRVEYVGMSSSSPTRTFPVEVTADVPSRDVPAGLTADIRVPMATMTAHKISPALLTLDDQGRIGVKTVNPDGEVAFHPVTMETDSLSGAWVSGLADEIRVITVGQDFVRAGTRVQAIEGELPSMHEGMDVGGQDPLDSLVEN